MATRKTEAGDKQKPAEPRRGWFEEYACGCASAIVRLKRDLTGYCGKHGHSRRHVHRVHPAMEKFDNG